MFDDIERILRALKRPDLAMLRRRAADLSRGAVEWVRTVVVGTVVTVVGGAVVRVVSAVRLDRIVAAKGVIALAAAALAGGWLVRSLFVVIGLADLGVAWALHVAEKSVARVERWARQDVSVGARGDDVPRIPSAAIPGLESLTGSLADLRARTIRMLRARDQLVREAGREIDRLAATTQELSAAGEELAATVQEISDDAGVNADAVRRAAEAAEMVASAAREIAEGLAEAVRLNTSMRELAETQYAAMVESARSVEEFLRDVRSAIDGMKELAAAAERTTAFVHTIRSITRQTNILAVNASIEAARFGQSGHGFGVVADEVRKLADKAAGAAAEIQLVVRDANRATYRLRSILDQCVRRGEYVALGVGEAAESFGTVVERTRTVADHMVVVHAGMEEIERQIEINTEALEVMSAEVTELAAAAQEMSATAEEMAAGLGELAEATEQLSNLLAAAASVSESTPQLSWRRSDVGGQERPGKADHLHPYERVHAGG